MIFRNLPAIITLVAALVAWAVTFICKYELTKALIIILATALVFFIIGVIVRALLNRFLAPEEKKEKEGDETEGEAAADDADTQDNE